MDYLNEVMSYLANRKLVLEVGCGGGYFANLLQQAGYDVLAGDIIDPKTPPGQFWKLQRLKLEVVPNFIRFDGRAIPFRDDTFDGVITIAVLEHVERDEVMFLHEISRICHPGGFFFIYKLPRKLSYEYLMTRLGITTAHNKLYTRNNIYELLNKSGFKVVTEKQYWYLPRSLIKLVNASILYLLTKRLKVFYILSSFLKVVAKKI
jgi:2-polyprenyl-3-methyl-5-hydroxy-6-metoxy-1,4-benzoquinol methylase